MNPKIAGPFYRYRVDAGVVAAICPREAPGDGGLQFHPAIRQRRGDFQKAIKAGTTVEHCKLIFDSASPFAGTSLT